MTWKFQAKTEMSRDYTGGFQNDRYYFSIWWTKGKNKIGSFEMSMYIQPYDFFWGHLV